MSNRGGLELQGLLCLTICQFERAVRHRKNVAHLVNGATGGTTSQRDPRRSLNTFLAVISLDDNGGRIAGFSRQGACGELFGRPEVPERLRWC
jgi:hypothetical protein